MNADALPVSSGWLERPDGIIGKVGGSSPPLAT